MLTPPPTATAQEEDALNLPTDLYILSNTGVITRVGVGQAGIRTITPDDLFIVDFAVAPQGDWLAYRTEQAITLTPLFETTQADFSLDAGAVDAPPIRGQGHTLAWSPDSSTLAYTTLFGLRVAFDVAAPFTQYTNISIMPIKHLVWSPEGTYLAAEAEQNIWWIYRRDGAQMTLASAIPSSYGLAWLNDSQLLFAPPEGGLIMMDLADLNTQTPLTDTTRVYYEPYLRPDGTLLAFSKALNDTDTPENAAFYQEFTLNQARAQAQSTSETPTELTNVFWGPGGRLMLSLQAGAPALLLPGTGVFFVLPFGDAVAFDWGGPQPRFSTGVITGRAAFFLAPTREGVVQVWRLPGDGLPATPITASLEDVERYAFSRNGRSLAYYSDGRLWLQALNTGDNTARALTTLQNPITDLGFDAAGQVIVYTVLSDEADGGVWLLPIETTTASEAEAAPQLVLPLSFSDGAAPAPLYTYQAAAFAPNVNALLLQRQTGTVVDYYVLDPVSGELSTIGAYDEAGWLADGRVYGTSADLAGSGIYAIDPRISPAEASLLLRVNNAFVQAPQEVRPGVLRAILVSQGRPGQSGVTLAELVIGEGAAQTLVSLPPMQEARLAPDGSFIAGYRQGGGTLLFYDLENAQETLLTSPIDVFDFQWAEFR